MEEGQRNNKKKNNIMVLVASLPIKITIDKSWLKQSVVMNENKSTIHRKELRRSSI